VTTPESAAELQPAAPSTMTNKDADIAALQASLHTLSGQLNALQSSQQTGQSGFGTYLPQPFSGDATENISLFIQSFEAFTDFMNYTDARKVSLIPVLLTGRAAAWFSTSDFKKCQKWDDMKKGPDAIGFLQQSILLDRHQGPTETVTTYANDVYQRLSLTGTADPEAWKTFVKGLRPELKPHVLMRQPKSLDDAQKHALEAEQLAAIQQPALVTTCAKVFQTLNGVVQPTPDASSTTQTGLEKKIDALVTALSAQTTTDASSNAPTGLEKKLDALVTALTAKTPPAA
jgi:hypothetical protein